MLPAEEFFDEQTKKVEMQVSELWSEEALNLFEKLASTATDTHFKQSEDIHDSQILFGEVIVTMDGKAFNIGSELVRLKLAVEVPSQKFLRTFNTTIASVTERWDDNSGQGGVLNTPDFIEVGKIASTSFPDHPFLFKFLAKRAEYGLILAENEAANSFSVSKVTHWLEKISGINNDDTIADSEGIEELLLSESRPPSHVTPTNRSRRNTLKQKSGETSRSGSDGQQTSSPQSEVPSTDTSGAAHDKRFKGFLKKKELEKSDGEKLCGLLHFMKQM